MAKFFLRTKLQKGSASLYVKVQRPKIGVQWWINSEIDVDIEKWERAQLNAKYLTQYFATENGKKVQEAMNVVEDIIRNFFEELKEVRSDSKKKLSDIIHAAARLDGTKAEEEIRKRELETIKEKAEEEKKRLCVIGNYYDYFIEGIKDGSIRQKRGAKKYTDGSITAWESFGKFLKGYCPEAMTFDQVNKKFADGFVCYLENLGLMPKTINKQVLCFRRLCNAAAIDEYNKNLISVRVWGEREVKDNQKRAEIALSDLEIDELYNMPLTGIREQVRDVWMLGYLSAQRVSDYAHFTRDNFKVTPNGVDVIILQQKKTGNDVVVPILDERVKELCRKYDYNFPNVEPRTLNRYIKEILQKLSASVPTLGEWVRTQLSQAERQKETTYLSMKERVANGEKLHGDELKRYKEMKAYAIEHESGEYLWRRDYSGAVVKYRWECVSSHTSRRSAVTSMYNSGLYDVRDMMSISGHKTIKNFEGYIKRGSIEHAERIAEKARKAKEIKMKRAK